MIPDDGGPPSWPDLIALHNEMGDPDPVRRWRAVALTFALDARDGWEHLLPMATLAAWVGGQPWGALLYPGTSMTRLTVRDRPGPIGDEPCLVCHVEPLFGDARAPRETLRCAIATPGRRTEAQSAPILRARELFAAFANRLLMGG